MNWGERRQYVQEIEDEIIDKMHYGDAILAALYLAEIKTSIDFEEEEEYVAVLRELKRFCEENGYPDIAEKVINE